MAGTHLVEGYLGEACPGAIDDAETLLTPKRKDGAGEKMSERMASTMCVWLYTIISCPPKLPSLSPI
jgi:hypothetical protein